MGILGLVLGSAVQFNGAIVSWNGKERALPLWLYLKVAVMAVSQSCRVAISENHAMPRVCPP